MQRPSSSGRSSRFTVFFACLLLGACASNAHIQRIANVPAHHAAELKSLPDADFAPGEFRSRDGISLRYRLLSPLDPKPGERYPLVLVLHGSGAIGNDNRKQLGAFSLAWASPALRARYPAYVLVPQFPARSAEYNASSPSDALISRATPTLSAALELVDAVVAAHAIDRARIYATGFSMGASATWLAPLLRPDLFAAAMPISGIAPDRADALRLTAFPLWVLHGDADTENPIDSDRAMVARIRALGGREVRLREYVGLDHRVADEVYLGTWWRDWLFAHRRATPAE